MDLTELYKGSFVNWEAVIGSFRKRTIPSRQMIFSARRYLEKTDAEADAQRREAIESATLPEEIKKAFAAPPDPDSKAAEPWGEFVDAAVVTELEMISYGERPPILQELRAGLQTAADEAGADSNLGRWFLARREALPGGDLAEESGYLPV